MPEMLRLTTICAINLFITGLSIGQSLSFQSTGDRIEHVFSFNMPENERKNILTSRGKKTVLRKFTLFYDTHELNTKSIHLRGQSSLYFQRKSFAVSLKKKWTIEGVRLKKFSLTNLVFDQNYWRNRFSYLSLQHLGIFPLLNCFATVSINGQSQGVYLLVQKPDDFVRSSKQGILLIRRNARDHFKLEFKKKQTEENWAEDKIQPLNTLNQYTKKYQGKELYDTLNQWIDMPGYLTWLAFNYVIMNGDYTDELFLFYDNETGRFRIIPWDYDDIFMKSPHEGWTSRNKKVDHPLIFSSEAILDRIIDRNPYIYERYTMAMKNVL